MDYKYIAYSDDELLFSQPPSKPINIKTVVLAISAILLGIIAYGTHSIYRQPSVSTVDPSIAKAPPTSVAAIIQPVIVPVKPVVAPHWEIIKIGPKDTLANIFNRLGIPAKDAHDVMLPKEAAKALTKMRISAELRLLIDPAHKLQQLNYMLNDTDILQVTRHNDVFQAQIIHQHPQIHLVYAGSNVEHSIAKSVQKAKLHPKINTQLTSIFKDQVDFNRIQPGDRFHVLYEEAFLGDKKLRTGDIVAASFESRGKTYHAVRYTDTKGHAEYYTPDGQSLRKGFLRSPVRYTHISSGYSLRRYHPVMHRVHAHRAVDFAAPRGTPIKATGDGKVTFAGKKGGYGNAVMIDHRNQHVTLYAHMHHFAKGVRSGTQVRAGDTIGYVGSTGMSTGPHVHYEMRVNGVHQNPLTVKLPNAAPLDRAAKAKFIPQARQLMARLEIDKGIRLASNADIKPHGG